MKHLGEVLQLSIAFLEERQVARPRRIAEELLATVLNCKRMDLYMQFDRPIEESELAIMRERLKRCAKGEPLEYVIGEVKFLGCSIKVDRRVLIPRLETEIMADLIVKRIQNDFVDGKVLWDLCTGSGCLGISIQKLLPSLSVAISDISDAALSLAKENVLANQVPVQVIQGDLFEPFQNKTADFIVANPPYISVAAFDGLQPSVRDYEPKLALIGGESGMLFYERLAKSLPERLNAGGAAFFEIGFDQKEAVKKIFSHYPWRGIEVLKDWSGHDRFFFLEKQ